MICFHLTIFALLALSNDTECCSGRCLRPDERPCPRYGHYSYIICLGIECGKPEECICKDFGGGQQFCRISKLSKKGMNLLTYSCIL